MRQGSFESVPKISLPHGTLHVQCTHRIFFCAKFTQLHYIFRSEEFDLVLNRHVNIHLSLVDTIQVIVHRKGRVAMRFI